RMGGVERPRVAAGTVAVARAVAAAPAFTVIGGGDTIAAVNAAGVGDKIGYISTAGGAFLEFLEGRTLPGVAALTEAAWCARRSSSATGRCSAPSRRRA